MSKTYRRLNCIQGNKKFDFLIGNDTLIYRYLGDLVQNTKNPPKSYRTQTTRLNRRKNKETMFNIIRNDNGNEIFTLWRTEKRKSQWF